MVIITGIGRCGTSVMAKYFKELGFDIGSDKWFEPVNAGFENKETLSINSRLLAHYVKGEKINPYYIWGDIHKLDYDVVKDPQFLAHTELIKNWWKVRQDLKVIFMHRRSADIVESAKKVMEWTQPTYRLFEDVIQQKNEAFLKTLDRLEIPYIKFKYPHISGEDVCSQVSEWIDLPNNALDTWREIYKV